MPCTSVPPGLRGFCKTPTSSPAPACPSYYSLPERKYTTIVKIYKRDGTIANFNPNRVRISLRNAAHRAGVNPMGELAATIERIVTDVAALVQPACTTERIHRYVVAQLQSSPYKQVAQSYLQYGEGRARNRVRSTALVKGIQERISASCVENANANVDERSFSGREKEALAATQKYMAIELGGLSDGIAKAHKDMLVYQHDLDKALFGQHNCLQLDMQRLFREGFSTRNGDVRPPSSFETACQLVAVAFQCQTQTQFGGVGTIHLDFDLAPFVRKSFMRHYKKGIRYREEVQDKHYPENDSIDNKAYAAIYPKAYEYAMDMLEEEGLQAAQGLYHNLNTLESRQGSQVPFSSVNLGRDTSPEGRMVTRWLMQASIDGIGRHRLTSIFPISILQHKRGVNARPGEPNYDLKRLALESMARRIYPNWANCDWSQANEEPGNPDTYFSTMGCRTLIGFDRHGLGYTRVGRGNNVPVTIILPKLGIEYGICNGKRSKPDIDGFNNALHDALELCEEGLVERFVIMASQSPEAAPFMYGNGTIQDADSCIGTVYNALRHNTLAIGYIGIAEMCVALFGKNHAESEQAHAFALSVVQQIHEFAKLASERNDLNFSCYATPAEGLCHTAAKALREQYGNIPNVTDREYLTNSHHVPVWHPVSVYDKLNIEAPFCKYPTGGCITYIELDAMFVKNIDAVEQIINYAFDELDIPYLAFNFPIDSCLACGHQGEFDSQCPQCGSTAIQQLRRVTGYLTTDYRNFNHGKQIEVEQRKKHS